MQLKTDAIVLKIQKFKDNASILHLYTLETGRASYLLYGAQSKKKGNAIAYLHPLSLVNLDVNIRNTRELNIITEIKQEEPTMELLFNPIKSSLAFFIAEILLQVLKTNERDDTLFSFLHHSISQLNHESKSLGNFHIAFLLRLSRFLGFQPSIDTPYNNVYFDMKQAEFTSRQPEHQYFLRSNETDKMKLLLRMNYRNFHLFRFTKAERSEVIDRILQYYRIHTQCMGDIKSLYVLKDIFE
ncbi:MAG: DNA repair protein RecO [Paludibacteraceae bacterium]|nr:DNA repair protein RecO [Paludibacteraceae bacterium]MBR5973423.1 DNA repair protein RecO [Paludibacteraceae bacterium]